MNEDDKAELYAALLLAAVVVAVIVAGLMLAEIRCLARWEGSTVPARYEWTKGCQLATARGWIPEEYYRLSN